MSLNGTASPSFYETVYAGTDFSSLSWAEQKWVAWYIWIGNPIIATGLMSFLLHEVCLLVRSIAYSSLTLPIGCLLWTLYPMDHHRRDAVLQPVEATAPQDPYHSRTMGLHEASPLLSLYYRAACSTWTFYLFIAAILIYSL